MNLVDLEDEYGFFVCLGFFVCFVLFIGFSRQGFFVALETVLELALWAVLASNHCPAVCFLSLFWLSILHIHLVIHSIRNFSFFR